MNRTLATVLAVLLSSAIGLFLLIVLRRRLSEGFTAEGFASAVIAQNPKVFERLREM